MKAQWQQEARDKYGLTPEQQREVEAAYSEPLEQASAAAQQPAAVVSEALPPGLDLLQCDVAALHTRQKQLLLVALLARLAQLAAAAVQQEPQLASLLTYEQQQQPAGWIAQGLAAAGAAEQGNGSDAKENRPSGCANLVVRQAGTAASRPAGKRHQGGSKKAGSSSSSKPQRSKAGGGSASSRSGKKRSRHKAGACGVGDEEEDAEDAFSPASRRCQCSRRRRGGGGCAASAGGGSGLLADLMRAALEAGVAQLLDTGFSCAKALDALQECNCDVTAAVEYLTAACC